MPYGCLDSKRLSKASLMALENAVKRWQNSMQISRDETFFILAGYKEDSELELRLRKENLRRSLPEDEFSKHVITLSANNEDNLAHKITRTKSLLPIETITVFAESRHAVSLRPIFKRKFGRALEIKTFKADFEFNHSWISTSTSSVWFLWNIILRIRFEFRKRTGRKLRRKLRSFFRL